MYKVYPGRESDQTTFQEFIEKIKFRPDLKQKIITFDAGCYSFKKVEQLETEGFTYVCMADISTHSLEGTPQEYIIDDDSWVLQPGSYKGRRVLEAYNATLHLAAIEKLSRKMGLVTQFIESVVGRTPDMKLKKVHELITGLGLKRLLTITLSDNDLVLTVHEEQVQTQKEKLKKLVLMTNLPVTTSDTTFVQYYLKRSSIEQVYRYIKSPFEIRPCITGNNTEFIHTCFSFS
jgi:transposase